MSYARFGWEGSRVYVFQSASGLECCGCNLGTNFCTSEPEQMILHLAQHRRAGHFVPESCILALWEDVPGPSLAPEAEPAGMTRAQLMFTMALLQERLNELPPEVPLTSSSTVPKPTTDRKKQ